MASADVATAKAKATLIDNLIIVSSHVAVYRRLAKGPAYHEFHSLSPNNCQALP